MKLNFLFFFLLISSTSFAQLEVDTNRTAKQFVHTIVGSNEVTVSRVNFTGHKASIGLFSHTLEFMFQKGLMLSTGDVHDAHGPNNLPNSGQYLGAPGDKELSHIVRGKTYDASVLSFDFECRFDSISFDFVFASEEYPEYANKNVNDVFGLFVYDYKNKTVHNLAELPSSPTPISVNTINHKKNTEYYVPSNDWKDGNGLEELRRNDNQQSRMAFTFQFDAFVKQITTGIRVMPGQKYRFTIAIADCGDPMYDSAVMIKKNSFQTHKTSDYVEVKTLEDELVTLLTENGFKTRESGSKLIAIANIRFETDKTILLPEAHLQLESVLSILKTKPSLHVNVIGHTDNQGKTSYNQFLSEKRAARVKKYLVQQGIDVSRIETSGKGASSPIATNDTAAGRKENRRVEFQFY